MLFILKNSPYKCDINSLLSIITCKDDLLLLSDGVFAGLKNSKLINFLNKCNKIYALKDDIIARGLCKKISSNILIINYDAFIKLTEKNFKNMIWQ